MKKLNKDKKSSSKVNPSILSNIDDYLAMLIPSAILTLVASLSEDDKQVLAYLISCSNNNPGNFNTKSINNSKARTRDQDGSYFGGKRSSHSPVFECDCFGCYMSFWARWDASENRQLIHEIIEAYEEGSAKETRVKSGGKMRRSKRRNYTNRVCEDQVLVKEEKVVVDEELVGLQKEDGFGFEEESGEVGIEKGSFRRFLSFVGEKVSGFWNMG